jgi:hypothetical protein
MSHVILVRFVGLRCNRLRHLGCCIQVQNTSLFLFLPSQARVSRNPPSFGSFFLRYGEVCACELSHLAVRAWIIAVASDFPRMAAIAGLSDLWGLPGRWVQLRCHCDPFEYIDECIAR